MSLAYIAYTHPVSTASLHRPPLFMTPFEHYHVMS